MGRCDAYTVWNRVQRGLKKQVVRYRVMQLLWCWNYSMES